MPSIKQTLEAARAVIADPSHWIQGELARDKDGNTISPDHPDACQWCGYGAVAKVTNCDDNLAAKVEDALRAAGRSLFPGEFFATDINDVRGHEAVMDVFNEAISQADS